MVYKASDEAMAGLHLAHDSNTTTEHYLKEHFEALAALKAKLFGVENLQPPTDMDDEDGDD